MEKFELTKETLLRARTYVPLEEKMAFVDENASKCFDRLQISADNDAMPPMYMENTALKSRYLMYALAVKYLRLAVESEFVKDEPSALLTVNEYDRFAGAHVLNQIQRFKSDAETRDICFDLLTDYADFEKRFNAQIHGLLTVQNDAVMRQSMMMKADMAQMPALLGEIKKLGEKKDGEGA